MGSIKLKIVFKSICFCLFLFNLVNVAFCTNEAINVGVVPNFPATIVANGYFIAAWDPDNEATTYIFTNESVTLQFDNYFKGVLINEINNVAQNAPEAIKAQAVAAIDIYNEKSYLLNDGNPYYQIDSTNIAYAEPPVDENNIPQPFPSYLNPINAIIVPVPLGNYVAAFQAPMMGYNPFSKSFFAHFFDDSYFDIHNQTSTKTVSRFTRQSEDDTSVNSSEDGWGYETLYRMSLSGFDMNSITNQGITITDFPTRVHGEGLNCSGHKMFSGFLC